MTSPLPARVVAGLALAAGRRVCRPRPPLPRSPTPAPPPCPPSRAPRRAPRRSPIRRTRRRTPTWRPDPNSNIHNDTWMTDSYRRAGPLGISLAPISEAKPPSLCGSLAFDSRGPDRQHLPVAGRAADGADHRPGHAGDDRRVRAADGAEPAEHARVPELHRRRLLLPRPQGPDLGADQDRPHLRARPERGRPGVRAAPRLRPDLGARREQRADHLGAARLRRPDLVRLEAQREGRHARPNDRRAEGEEARRGDRELVRDRRGRRLHRLRQAHVPVQPRTTTASRGSSGRSAIRTRGSSSRARSTPARGPPRP